MQQIIVWPPLELDPIEREYVAHYANPAKPGVLRRAYGATLVQSIVAGVDPQPTQIVNFSGRRTRVFGFTFSGDVSAWLLTISNPAGTLYTTQRSSVAAMCGLESDLSQPGGPAMPEWIPGTINGAYLSSAAPLPVLRDPCIVIEGTDSLIFEGVLSPTWIAYAEGEDYTAVLNIAVHCWEFPDYPRERPFVDNKGKVSHRKVAAGA